VKLRWVLVGVGLVFLVAVFCTALLVLHWLALIVVVAAALALLIAGGNYLNSVLGIRYRAQQFNKPAKRRGERSSGDSR
jgi:membrane protein implicated in regulation of membrane protease activity